MKNLNKQRQTTIQNMHKMFLHAMRMLYISCVTYHGKTSIFMLDNRSLKALNKYFATFRIFSFSSSFMIHVIKHFWWSFRLSESDNESQATPPVGKELLEIFWADCALPDTNSNLTISAAKQNHSSCVNPNRSTKALHKVKDEQHNSHNQFAQWLKIVVCGPWSGVPINAFEQAIAWQKYALV